MDFRSKKIALLIDAEFFPEDKYLIRRFTSAQSKMEAENMVERLQHGIIRRDDNMRLEIMADDLIEGNKKLIN